MDEPLGTLDTEFRDLMVRELRELHNRIGATTVYVTHDQLEAMAMADKIAVMNRGVIEQFATPQEIYDRPGLDVRRRLHRLAADEFPSAPTRPAEGRARASHERRDRSRAGDARGSSPETELALGIRPEHIRFDDTSPLRGSVFGAEYLGTTQIVTVTTEHGQIKARLPASLRVASGETVGLAFRGERLSLFDKSSGRAIASALDERRRAWLRSRSPTSASASAQTLAVDRPRLSLGERRVRGAARPDRRGQDDDASARRRAWSGRSKARSESTAAT